MKIKRMESCCMAEFEDCITCVLFFQGCDLDCAFCQNHELIPMGVDSGINIISTYAKFYREIEHVDWVSFSGGEVLFHHDWSGVKHMIDKSVLDEKKINIDTNGVDNDGTKSKRLAEISKYVDCLSVDIKPLMTMPRMLDISLVKNVRFRITIVKFQRDVYMNNGMIENIRRYGTNKLKLIPNSMQGRGANFPPTTDEYLKTVAKYFEDNGIEITR